MTIQRFTFEGFGCAVKASDGAFAKWGAVSAALKEKDDRIAELEAEMDAVADYLKPNWSNDMSWSDEIIIAIENGHGRNDRRYAQQMQEEIDRLKDMKGETP